MSGPVGVFDALGDDGTRVVVSHDMLGTYCHVVARFDQFPAR